MNVDEASAHDATIGLLRKDPDAIKLFIGQVPKTMEADALLPLFSEFGEVFDLAIIRDKQTGLHRGCAFLTYCTKNAAEAATAALHGNRKLVGSQNALQVRPAEGHNERDNKLFVGMVPKTAEENELRNVFGAFGELREVHIIRNPDGTNKGCAFVKFMDRDSAVAAIDGINEQITLEGAPRPLVVKFADNNKRNTISRMGPVQGGTDSSPFWSPPGGVLGNVGITAPGATDMYGYQRAYGATAYPPPTDYPNPYLSNYMSAFQNSTMGYATPPTPTPPVHTPTMALYNLQAKDLVPHSNPLYPPIVKEDSTPVRPQEGPPGANLFIYHLPQDLTDADLATAFASFGNVISAKVYVDRVTNESKGFGFVSYDSPEAAVQAISHMNGFQIGSKRLKVQHKRDGNQFGGTSGGDHPDPLLLHITQAQQRMTQMPYPYPTDYHAALQQQFLHHQQELQRLQKDSHMFSS